MDANSMKFKRLTGALSKAIKAFLTIIVWTQAAALMMLIDVLLAIILEPVFGLIRDHTPQSPRMITKPIIHNDHPVVAQPEAVKEDAPVNPAAVRRMLTQPALSEEELSEKVRPEDFEEHEGVSVTPYDFESKFLSRVSSLTETPGGDKKVAVKQRTHKRKSCEKNPRKVASGRVH